jgi:hypothetical protein
MLDVLEAVAVAVRNAPRRAALVELSEWLASQRAAGIDKPQNQRNARRRIASADVGTPEMTGFKSVGAFVAPI